MVAQHRGSVFEGVRIGRETSPGVAVPALVDLKTVNIDAGPRANVNEIKPKGSKYAGMTDVGKEWTEANVDGRGTYTEIVYPLTGVLGLPVITTPPGWTNARKWNWKPNTSSPDFLPTFTIEQGSPAFGALRASGGTFTGLTMNSNRDGVDFTGALIAGLLEEDGVELSGLESQNLAVTGGPTGGTFTLTHDGKTTGPIAYNAAPAAVQAALEALDNVNPGDVLVSGAALPGGAQVIRFRGQLAYTDVALLTADDTLLTGGTSPEVTVTQRTAGAALTRLPLRPLSGKHVTTYLDDAYDDIGTLELDSVTSSWGLTGRANPVWVQNANYPSFHGMVEVAPTAEVKTLLEFNARGREPLAMLREGQRKYFRWEAKGAVIDAGVPETAYRLTVDIALEVFAVGRFVDNEGLFAIEYTYKMVDDADLGGALAVELVTTVQTI